MSVLALPAIRRRRKFPKLPKLPSMGRLNFIILALFMILGILRNFSIWYQIALVIVIPVSSWCGEWLADKTFGPPDEDEDSES